ncbi:helix-turn-helix transcriptional regulator [Ekhidna sp. To15]|uniref:AraC family transcriptional regulator n=1 Tax=Ekhidna sp. To15 TaxID=3395267 RepID=UPI003F522FC6
MLVDLYSYFCEAPELKNKIIGTDYLSAEYKCPIDVERLKFWNEMHLISFVISGKKDWFVDGEKFEMNGGDAAFITKGVYSTKQYFEVDHCVIVFMLNDKFIKKFLLEYESLNLPRADFKTHQAIYAIDMNDSLKSIIFSVSNYLKQGKEVPQELVEIKFKELLFNLLIDPKNTALGKFFCALRDSDRSNLESIMNKHFQFNLSLVEFARLCGKSLSTFKREFQEHFHQTPGKWILDKRLNYAKTLLKTSSLNINEVCYESGFKNTTHFSKAFKNHFRLTPAQFRRDNSL